MNAMQRRTFAACFIAYTGAYIARYNWAAALPALMEQLNLTGAQAGLPATLFAVVYAAGQLVSGAVVDRVRARDFLVAGLAVSALCNLGISFCRSFALITVLWCVNGAAQAMLWTPIVKLFALRYSGAARAKATFGISFSLVIGQLLAWAGAGALSQAAGWRWAFAVSAATALLSAVAAFFLLGGDVGDESAYTARQRREGGAMPLKKMFFATGLVALLLACVANGFVRDSVMTWAPNILSKLSGGSSSAVSLMIPCLNMAGLLLGKLCLRRFGGGARRTTAYVTAFCVPFTLLLGLVRGGSVWLTAVLLSACSALMYGVNPLMTSLIPMEYDKAKRVGLVAGLMDSAIYLGSGLSGVATGAMLDNLGLNVTALLWSAAAVLAAAATFFAAAKKWKTALE
ncbi:MAG: MFS transporter [Eubacteriales bacterium]|nr:MFS transporter [Eubacteriales bacterium]